MLLGVNLTLDRGVTWEVFQGKRQLFGKAERPAIVRKTKRQKALIVFLAS
jgi:hypothetical protein